MSSSTIRSATSAAVNRLWAFANPDSRRRPDESLEADRVAGHQRDDRLVDGPQRALRGHAAPRPPPAPRRSARRRWRRGAPDRTPGCRSGRGASPSRGRRRRGASGGPRRWTGVGQVEMPAENEKRCDVAQDRVAAGRAGQQPPGDAVGGLAVGGRQEQGELVARRCGTSDREARMVARISRPDGGEELVARRRGPPVSLSRFRSSRSRMTSDSGRAGADRRRRPGGPAPPGRRGGCPGR